MPMTGNDGTKLMDAGFTLVKLMSLQEQNSK